MNVLNWNPSDLLQRPSLADAKAISPPVETRVQKLPFNELTWENFERLCARLVATDKTIIGCHRYGVQGEKQQGIDLLAERQCEDRVELWCFQCKRYRKFNPSHLKATLDQVMFKADKYVVIISCDASRVLRDMAQERPNTVLWDAEDLSRQLKDQHGIVEDFFGVTWRRAFCGPWPPEVVARKPVEITLDYDLLAIDRHKREELVGEVAKVLNIEPDAIGIKMIVEGTIRMVLELPALQAEELLALYRQQNPQLGKVIEQFRIVKIKDLEPPSELSEPGEPGPTGPAGSPSTPISEQQEYFCSKCGERFTLDKGEEDYFSMKGVGLVPMTLPVRCKRHRRVRGRRATILGRSNIDIPNAESGQGCFECFTKEDLPEVASWGITQFPWEQVVPAKPVGSPNTVKFEVDYQIGGVLALEETPEGQLHVKALEYAPWIDHYTNARKALPLYAIAESIRRGHGGAFSIDIGPADRPFYESLGFQREFGTDRYYLSALTACRLVLQEEGVGDAGDFPT